ncbi:hypothetical protein C0580_01080 [Candidatus Parcubacteria bacterium]|nr:MAG: hypothetical protein C0580_01080 [Candidatus Parcubacteria bacterium]
MSVYDHVNCEKLNKFAEAAGLGEKIPADFLQFKKYLEKGDKILEIGCGTGRIGKHLIKKYKYIGIDNHLPYLKCFEDYLTKNKIKLGDNDLINVSFENFEGNDFDIIIFPWTVIGDFSKGEQLRVIKKAKNQLKKEGLVLIDNPTKGTTYNEAQDYEPCRFYFDEWEEKLNKLFTTTKKILYTTPTKRVRELTVLKK